MAVTIRNKFDLGQTVYLRVSPEMKGMVVSIVVSPLGLVYVVGWGDGTQGEHYEMELTDEQAFAT